MRSFERHPGARPAHVARDQPQDRRTIAGVDQRELAAEIDLVAEQRGQRITLGVAADEAEQRVIVDFAEFLAGKAEGAAEPHAEQARLQPVPDALPMARSVASDRQATISARRTPESA